MRRSGLRNRTDQRSPEMGTSHWAVLVGALALAGCGGAGNRAESSKAAGGPTGHADSGAMGTGHMDSGRMKMGHMDSGGMGMGGMHMPGMQMMSNMRANMDSMRRMSPRQMQAMMAMHEQRDGDVHRADAGRDPGRILPVAL
jgi:hypothetical protein